MRFICHIHNYTEYKQQWNVFSAFNPSKCTHLEQWAADAAAPGEQLGVRCLAQGSHLSRGQFLLRFEPTTSGYKSDALSIRPRLSPRSSKSYCHSVIRFTKLSAKTQTHKCFNPVLCGYTNTYILFSQELLSRYCFSHAIDMRIYIVVLPVLGSCIFLNKIHLMKWAPASMI